MSAEIVSQEAVDGRWTNAWPDPEYAAYAEDPLSEDRRIPWLSLLVVPFLMSAVSVAALPGANYFVWGLGVLCAFGYALTILRGQMAVPKELVLQALFVTWMMLGRVNVEISWLFWEKYSQQVQFLLLTAILAQYTINLRTFHLYLGALILGTLVVSASGYLSGDYARAEEHSPQRVAGLALNSNAFAITLVFGGAPLFYFLKVARSKLLKGLIIGILIGFVALIIASGSRTGFAGFALLLLAWFVLAYGTEIRQRPWVFLGGTLALAVVAIALYLSLSGSFLEKRFGGLSMGAGGTFEESSAAIRQQLYRDGLAMLYEHPLVGVGAGQFIAHASRLLYGHSNYVEVFSGTGIPGGLLYYSIFVALWLRLRRLSKWFPADHRILPIVRLGQVVILVRLLSDLGHVSWTEKSEAIVLGLLIGWSYHAEKSVRQWWVEEAEAEASPAV